MSKCRLFIKTNALVTMHILINISLNNINVCFNPRNSFLNYGVSVIKINFGSAMPIYYIIFYRKLFILSLINNVINKL